MKDMRSLPGKNSGSAYAQWITMASLSILAAALSLAFSLECLEMYCPSPSVTPNQLGNHLCDPSCLSPMCGFDSSDCASLCLCSSSDLNNGLCDAGEAYLACNTAECQWDGGKCGYCSSGCKC